MSRTALKISKHIPSVFQGRLDFGQLRSFSLSREHPMERLVFRVILACILASIFAYLYFVSASVLNVIARKEAQSDIHRLQSTISAKEQQYFALSQEITPGTAAHLGLLKAEEPFYIYRGGGAVAARIGGNEI